MLLSDQKFIFIGGGGHASVLLDLVRAQGYEPIGICDPLLAKKSEKKWNTIPVLGDDSVWENKQLHNVSLVNAVGCAPSNALRKTIFSRMKILGYSMPMMVHPFSWVSPSAQLGEGVQVMAGAVVQANSVVGANSIINSSASIDHDCFIGSDVHIAPGVTLCGGVKIGSGVFIGAGAIVAPGVSIGNNSIVGAGSSVLRDIGKFLKVIPVLRISTTHQGL